MLVMIDPSLPAVEYSWTRLGRACSWYPRATVVATRLRQSVQHKGHLSHPSSWKEEKARRPT